MTKRISMIASAFIGLMLLSAAHGCKRGDTNPASPDVKAGDAVISCNIDADCTVVKDGCCGCNEGGKQCAIATNAVEAWLNNLSCDDTFCAQVISRDLSCSQKPACVAGRCQLK